MKELRERLRSYITAKERAEQDKSYYKGNTAFARHVDQSRPRMAAMDSRRVYGTVTSSSRPATSAQALVSTEKPSKMYSDKCRYCTNRHWSDECTKYKTIEERKQVLKNSCHKCLKSGHKTSDCKGSKICVHCGEKNVHHRSLCPKKFKMKRSIETVQLIEEISDPHDKTGQHENVLVSSNESVLMQTAQVEVVNSETSAKTQIRLLLDSGSQRTYVSEKLADQLGLVRGEEQEIKVATFGSKAVKVIITPTTKLDIKLNNNKYMTVCANIVPDITGTIHRKAVKLTRSDQIVHLINSLDMADTIPSESEYSSVE